MTIGIVFPAGVTVAFVLLMNHRAASHSLYHHVCGGRFGAFLTQNTTFGRYLYAIGGTRKRAPSGINCAAFSRCLRDGGAG